MLDIQRLQRYIFCFAGSHAEKLIQKEIIFTNFF